MRVTTGVAADPTSNLPAPRISAIIPSGLLSRLGIAPSRDVVMCRGRVAPLVQDSSARFHFSRFMRSAPRPRQTTQGGVM